MPETYSKETSGALGVANPQKLLGNVYNAKLKRIRASVALAAQASGDTIVLGDLPAGAVFAYGMLTSDTSLGTATLAIGPKTAAGKYRTAAVFTATNVPTPFGNATAIDDAPLAKTERVVATVGAAALPGAGNLVIDLFYSDLA